MKVPHGVTILVALLSFQGSSSQFEVVTGSVGVATVVAGVSVRGCGATTISGLLLAPGGGGGGERAGDGGADM